MRKHFITRMAGMVMAGLMAFSMSAPVMAEEAAGYYRPVLEPAGL